jgi:hypothetical protein
MGSILLLCYQLTVPAKPLPTNTSFGVLTRLAMAFQIGDWVASKELKSASCKQKFVLYTDSRIFV